MLTAGITLYALSFACILALIHWPGTSPNMRKEIWWPLAITALVGQLAGPILMGLGLR